MSEKLISRSMTAPGAKPSFVPKPHVVMKQGMSNRQYINQRPQNWLFATRARHKSRPYVFEGEACAACHQQRSRAVQDKIANSYIIEVAIYPLVEFPFDHASGSANKTFTSLPFPGSGRSWRARRRVHADVRDNRATGLERAVSIHPAREPASRPRGRPRHSIR